MVPRILKPLICAWRKQMNVSDILRKADAIALLAAEIRQELNPPLPPVENLGSISTPTYGAEEDSLTFDPSLPGRRHRVYLMSGTPVRYTLPAAGFARAWFGIVTTPKYGAHIYGPNPRMTRRVEDESGRVIIEEKDMGFNGGGFMAQGPFTGPIYLVLEPKDFTGWVFVECSAYR